MLFFRSMPCVQGRRAPGNRLACREGVLLRQPALAQPRGNAGRGHLAGPDEPVGRVLRREAARHEPGGVQRAVLCPCPGAALPGLEWTSGTNRLDFCIRPSCLFSEATPLFLWTIYMDGISP